MDRRHSDILFNKGRSRLQKPDRHPANGLIKEPMVPNIFSTRVLALGTGLKQVMKESLLACEAMGRKGKWDQSEAEKLSNITTHPPLRHRITYLETLQGTSP